MVLIEVGDKFMHSSIYVIFGAGQAGKDLAHNFPTKISYFVDNDPNKWETFYLDIPIFHPDKLIHEDKARLRIFVASMYFDQIRNQLNDMGFENHEHYWNVNLYYGLLERVNLLDLIEAEVNETAQKKYNSSTFLERSRMIYTIQDSMVSHQQNMKLLLVIDSANRQTEWVSDIIQGLEKLFKLQVTIYMEKLATTEADWEHFVIRCKKLGYYKLLYLGPDFSSMKMYDHNNFKCFCCSYLPPMAQDKKAWIDRLYEIINELGFDFKKVSVVVPNYNYENFIFRRLSSIVGQQYPIYEIIFLDDASDDDSVSVAQGLLDEHCELTHVVINDRNSGSVFKQWKKGLEMVRGDYVWIAEADDYASPVMLSTLMNAFGKDAQVVLSFCDSMFVSGNGEWQGFYSDAHVQYANETEARGFFKQIYDGTSFIKQYLTVRNSIPNVSAVVMKKSSMKTEYLERLAQFNLCGDWYFYIAILSHGKAACETLPLNFFTRHSNAVTMNADKDKLMREIEEIRQALADLSIINEVL